MADNYTRGVRSICYNTYMPSQDLFVMKRVEIKGFLLSNFFLFFFSQRFMNKPQMQGWPPDKRGALFTLTLCLR